PSFNPPDSALDISSIEHATLTGGSSANNINTSGFSGPVHIEGRAGNDILVGGPSSDEIFGQDGDDTLTGNGGNDTLNGGFGDDTVREQGNVNFTANNSNLFGLGTDSLSGIDRVDLTGGTGNNTLDASAFGGRAILHGGDGND